MASGSVSAGVALSRVYYSNLILKWQAQISIARSMLERKGHTLFQSGTDGGERGEAVFIAATVTWALCKEGPQNHFHCGLSNLNSGPLILNVSRFFDNSLAL